MTNHSNPAKVTKSMKGTKGTKGSETGETSAATDHAVATYDASHVGQTVTVEPGTLLMDRNIRQAEVDPGLVKSLAAIGMIEPINAVVTDAGALLVRHGHRRTLAAVEAQVPALVYISGTDATDDASEITRLIAQRDENTHRAGLSVAEDVGVVAQLAAFGLSPNQIAKRSRIQRGQVDAALAVAGSDLATAAAGRYEALTLDQAATVAEFEDDPETVKALIVSAVDGRFAHVAQRARDDRDRRKRAETVLAPVREAEVTVIEAPTWTERNTLPLERLRLDPHAEPGTRVADPAEHAECPGHVAWADTEVVYLDADGTEVDDEACPEGDEDDPEVAAYIERHDNATATERAVVVYGCQGWQERGHIGLWQRVGGQGEVTGASLSPEQADSAEAHRAREAAEAEAAETKRAARRLVIENNKAWDSAETVRREHLAQFVARKTPPKGTGAFLATAIALDAHAFENTDGNALAASWIDSKATPAPYGRTQVAADAASKATEARATVLALVQVLAAYETNLNRGSWRHDNTNSATGRYLRFLADATGYTLSDVEEYAISAQTA